MGLDNLAFTFMNLLTKYLSEDSWYPAGDMSPGLTIGKQVILPISETFILGKAGHKSDILLGTSQLRFKHLTIV
jgi:hypothetical protein